MNNIWYYIHNLCCHTCGGHSGAVRVLVLLQLWGGSTSSSDSICFYSNGLDLILKEHTCLNKALTPVAQIRAKLRSMRSKELLEELRERGVASQIWTRLEKYSAAFILSESSVVSLSTINCPLWWLKYKIWSDEMPSTNPSQPVVGKNTHWGNFPQFPFYIS